MTGFPLGTIGSFALFSTEGKRSSKGKETVMPSGDRKEDLCHHKSVNVKKSYLKTVASTIQWKKSPYLSSKPLGYMKVLLCLSDGMKYQESVS